MGSGVRLSVDYANPQLATDLTVEAPLDGDPADLPEPTRRVASALLGPEPLQRLVSLARPDAPRHPERISGGGDYGPATAGVPRAALGRFVLLAETAADPDLSPLATATAALEAAAVAAAVADPAGSVLLGPARELATPATWDLVALAAAGQLAFHDPQVEQEMAAILRRVVGVLDDEVLARRLSRLAGDLGDGPVRNRPATAAMAPAAWKPAAGGPAPAAPAGPAGAGVADRSRRAATTRITVDAPAGTVATLVTATEVEVRADEASREGVWARVFRRRDRLLLALAPLRASTSGGRGARALLVVPTGLTPDDLLVDLTDDPAATRPSADLVSLRQAVALGRAACRLERSGDHGGASAQWRRSADAWDSLGDQERAESARRYAAGDQRERGRGSRQRRSPQAPFLSDRLD
jgi:hypothetical protein